MSRFALALLMLAICPFRAESAGQDPPLESQERLAGAAQAFAEARAACEEDDGRLWGRRLWAPFMLVDRATRTFVANEAIGEADPAAGVIPTKPVEIGGEVVHVGALPANFSVANTAADYAGRRWAMAVWPIPDTAQGRRQLLGHELWHRIQDEVGAPLVTPACEHLDTEEGRLWLRLEMRALAAALRAKDQRPRRRAIEDALAFRNHRRSLFEGAGENERKLELAEGLAEYTGLRLSGREDPAEWSASDLGRAEKKTSFVRSFPYLMGPAYGLLLDEASPEWRKRLNPGKDLGAMLDEASRMPGDSGAAMVQMEDRAAPYGGAAVREEERRRAEERDARQRQLVAVLVEGPVLEAPMGETQISFDPGTVTPLPPHGTVYPRATLTHEAAWTLEAAEAEILVGSDWKAAFVSMAEAPETAADGRTVRGAGWTLRLEPGWTIVEVEAGRRWRLRGPD